MDTMTPDTVKKDFLNWSGGFPPDSEQQIFIYMEYAYGAGRDHEDEVREILRYWMLNNDDDIRPFP
jgi:hypothetical protein